MELTKSNGEVKSYRSGGLKRFIYWLRHGKWVKCHAWVGYGKQLDTHGRISLFYNDGEYNNERDAEQALRAFCE